MSPQWQQLVTQGHVWQARLNQATWIGALVLGMFAISLTRDIHGNTIGLVVALTQVRTDQPASWRERFWLNPWQTVTSSITGTSGRQARPQIDWSGVQPLPAGGVDPHTLTSPADLAQYVSEQLAALQSTGQLSAEYPACDPMTSLAGQPWVNSRTGLADIPRCLVGARAVWMASVVGNGQRNPSALPWLGVFHKEGTAGWTYRNVSLRTESALLHGHTTISLEMVAYQVAEDFPGIIMPAPDQQDEGATK